LRRQHPLVAVPLGLADGQVLHRDDARRVREQLEELVELVEVALHLDLDRHLDVGFDRDLLVRAAVVDRDVGRGRLRLEVLVKRRQLRRFGQLHRVRLQSPLDVLLLLQQHLVVALALLQVLFLLDELLLLGLELGLLAGHVVVEQVVVRAAEARDHHQKDRDLDGKRLARDSIDALGARHQYITFARIVNLNYCRLVTVSTATSVGPGVTPSKYTDAWRRRMNCVTSDRDWAPPSMRSAPSFSSSEVIHTRLASQPGLNCWLTSVLICSAFCSDIVGRRSLVSRFDSSASIHAGVARTLCRRRIAASCALAALSWAVTASNSLVSSVSAATVFCRREFSLRSSLRLDSSGRWRRKNAATAMAPTMPPPTTSCLPL